MIILAVVGMALGIWGTVSFGPKNIYFFMGLIGLIGCALELGFALGRK